MNTFNRHEQRALRELQETVDAHEDMLVAMQAKLREAERRVEDVLCHQRWQREVDRQRPDWMRDMALWGFVGLGMLAVMLTCVLVTAMERAQKKP